MNTDGVDFIMSLGGDGTLLHVAALFQGIMPPVLSFALGTLGFLTPFCFHSFEDTLHSVFDGDVSVNMRMRLQCEIKSVS